MYWIHSDHLSGASILVDSNGEITNWYEYMPYGEMLMENTTMNYDHPYKFNGKELDMATGYYYYGARYYDPKRSFWLSVDPLAEITVSPYAYVWNDPVNYADPSGMMGEKKGNPNDWGRKGNKWEWKKEITKDNYQKLGYDGYSDGKTNNTYKSDTGSFVALRENGNWSKDLQPQPYLTSPPKQAWSDFYRNGNAATISSPSPARGKSKFDYVMVDANPLMQGISERICAPCGTIATLIEFAAESQNSTIGNTGSKVLSAEKNIQSLNRKSFVNAYAGGGANVENIPLIQREQIQRAADKWNVEITVIGSRARGSANYGSDWDYIVSEIKPKMLHDMRFRLPKSELSRGDLGRARLEIWKGTVKKNEAHITFKPFRN